MPIAGNPVARWVSSVGILNGSAMVGVSLGRCLVSKAWKSPGSQATHPPMSTAARPADPARNRRLDMRSIDCPPLSFFDHKLIGERLQTFTAVPRYHLKVPKEYPLPQVEAHGIRLDHNELAGPEDVGRAGEALFF